MDFVSLLKSIEELLYELVSWRLFHPLTLWKCVRRPIQMMLYAEAELSVDDPKKRFVDALSPPIFLLLTTLLAHLVELRLDRPAEITLTGVLADDRNLLLFRAVVFSLFPLLLATQRVRQLGQPLTRETLRPAFYSQCYIAVPFALSVDVAGIAVRQEANAAVMPGLCIFAAGLAWYIGVLTRWLAIHGGNSRGRAFLKATAMVVLGLLANFLALLGVAFLLSTG